MPQAAAAADPAKTRQIVHFWPVFGGVCLDSRLSPAISPATRRGIFLALFVFALCAKIEPIEHFQAKWHPVCR
jgi:hypothetical protein